MSDSESVSAGNRFIRQLGLIMGPVLSLSLLFFLDLNQTNPAVTRTAAVAILMAVWWLTEAIPIPATAILPVALFPMLGIMSGREVAGTYFNNIIFLFIGGFIMALAMQRWELHRRIALRTILLIGAGPRRVVLGFMLATAFLSMWISNTATTMMMVPIAMAVILKLKEMVPEKEIRKFAAGLLISIAYSASIGGMATLIGTPPNLVFSRIFATSFPNAPEISFANWFLFGLPMAVVLLAAAWLLVTWMLVPKSTTISAGKKIFQSQHRQLGSMSVEEKLVAFFFTMLALLWLFRTDIKTGLFVIPGWSHFLPEPSFIDDGTVAIIVAVILFLIPSRSKPGKMLMDWSTARKLNWGIIILFGGGFALAAGFKQSGLSQWVAQQLSVLQGTPPLFMVAAVSTMMTFLTELTSNTATTQITLPLLGSLAVAINANPLLLMIPATVSASCAFMLPVATPPNAIIFGTGQVRMADLIRVGIILNLVGIILIVAMMYLFGISVFDINLAYPPVWISGG